MSGEFDIRREVALPATPEQVFAAVTSGTAAWMFPTGEPGPDDPQVTAWDPPGRFAVRVDGEDGWFNALEYLIEARDGGTAVLRYVHSGILTDDWDNQYDGASKHTDFYLHTLGQYLRHFAGRAATYVAVDGPAAATSADAFSVLKRALGLTDQAAPGDPVRLELPGLDPVDTVVDYLNAHFLGLRAADGLCRFFGRNAWGMPVGLSLHLFGDNVDQDKTEQAASSWLTGVFG